MKTRSFVLSSDDQLVVEMPVLAQSDRSSAADFVAGLAEFDGRKLYLGLGYGSIYSYCAAVLHVSDGAAYRRIEAARAARKFPAILEMLHDGRLSLATAALVGRQLTTANAEDLLRAVQFKSKREVEVILAKRNPKPPVPSVVRKLPEPAVIPAPAASEEPPLSLAGLALPRATPPPPSRRPIVAPLSESHYKLQVTISASSRERLSEIQGLMRHRLPSGDPAAIVEHALEVLHAQLLKEKAAQVARPRVGKSASEAKGRYIPASVKREVWRRDQGKCAFAGEHGTRCGSEDGVEFHHVQPYAVGGQATVQNIELRCRSHNGFEWARHIDGETLALAGR